MALPRALNIRFLIAAALLIAAAVPARASLEAVPADDRAQEEFFESKVRPVIASRCLLCHGREKSKGGLRLDSREAVMKGAESGPVVLPGKPEESRLIAAVRYQGDVHMPPKGKLADDEIAALTAWVKHGAHW